MDAAIAQVGPRVRAARHARDWTLDDLARRAGLSVSTLSRLESGKRGASLELLRAEAGVMTRCSPPLLAAARRTTW